MTTPEMNAYILKDRNAPVVYTKQNKNDTKKCLRRLKKNICDILAVSSPTILMPWAKMLLANLRSLQGPSHPPSVGDEVFFALSSIGQQLRM